MKSMEEYINEVYQKYEESERNHEVYKKVKVKYHNPLTTLCGVAACILVLCVGIFSVNKFNKEPEIKYASEEAKDNEIKYYTKYIWIDREFEESLKEVIKKSDVITIISDVNSVNCGYTLTKGQFALETKGILTIEKVLKGEIDENKVEFSKYGGTISLAELEKDTNIDWKEWETIYLNEVIPNEKKAITYFKQVPSKGCEIEEGKQYLVFMKYNEEKDLYNIFDVAYGIIEYDPITNMIKNIDTGEFEEFDWSLIS